MKHTKSTTFMRMKFLLQISFCCLFISCTSQSNRVIAEDIPTISISCEKDQVLNLSEFADSIELIPLETTDENLIGWIHRIIATPDKYYLSSAVGYFNRKLFVFDKKGKFIRQIGREGQGPQEYIRMSDFALVNDSTVKISESFSLACYNTEGDFLRKERLPDCPQEIYSFNGKVYGLAMQPSLHENKILFQMDNGTRTTFVEVSPLVAKVCDYYGRGAMFTSDENHLYFSHPFSTVIYQLNAETLEYEPFYQVDYGDKEPSWDIFENVEDKRKWTDKMAMRGSFLNTDEFIDLNEHFIINSMDEIGYSCISFYSKKTGKVLTGQRIRDDLFFKGNQIKLKPRHTPHYRDGDYLLWPIQPETLINGYNAYRKALGESKWKVFCQKYPRLVEVCEQLKEDENQVLLKIKLKEF